MIKDLEEIAEKYNKTVMIVFYIDRFACGYAVHAKNPLLREKAQEYAESEIQKLEKELRK